jgi:hypothetical protein
MSSMFKIHICIQGVSGGIVYIQGVSVGIVNILGGGSMDYFE